MKSADDILKSGLLESYVLGNLSPEDTEQVETFLRAYPELLDYVRSLEEPLEAAARAHAIAPKDSLFSQITERIAIENRPPAKAPEPTSSSRPSAIWKALAIGTIVIGSLLSAWLYRKYKTAESSKEAAEYVLFNTQRDCEDLAERQKRYESYFTLMRHPDTKTYPVGPDLGVFWNPTTRETALAYDRLPGLEQTEDYQLWADVEGRMISIGVLSDKPEDLQVLQFITGAESINVTIEPEGGSEEPTVSRLIASIKV